MVTDILTDCAPKTTLDCASGRTSLRVATAKADSHAIPGQPVDRGIYALLSQEVTEYDQWSVFEISGILDSSKLFLQSRSRKKV
jgi:hypothetical protein